MTKRILSSLLLFALIGLGCNGANPGFSGSSSADEFGDGLNEEVVMNEELQAALSMPGGVAAGRYIVVLEEDVPPEEVLKGHGVIPDAVYEHALHGFAARMTSEKAEALGRDRRVAHVESDRVVSIEARPGEVHATIHENNFETTTSGIDRIDADLNPRTDVSSVGIAIIDTGIWLQHSDLNVAGSVSFVTGNKTGNDDNGHGTHCAGIATAKTNDNHGVRGVAPNARLYAVKVLNKSGSGLISWIIKGVDWVTQNRVSKGIQVANMSLGFAGNSAALDTAITNSVNAGVTYVVAAGNESSNASGFSPANHSSVIAVSAIGDTDGVCGGAGPDTSYSEPDDSFASFSNFGSAVEIAAPGVDILSTWKGDKRNPAGLYSTISGTSMASPHVAGAAAQYIASHPGSTPDDVRDALIAFGVPQGQGCVQDGDGGFTADPDSFEEPLVYAADL